MSRRAHGFSIGVLLWAAMVLGPSSAAAREVEPRLILPGGRLVHAGQVVDLSWSAADSISELEILLSVDGGKHYLDCISPRLDPRRSHFVWRVPDLGNRVLRMRIRFNRGGREIEGAPTQPLLALSTRGGPEPLALPSSAGERAPREDNSRTEMPVGRSPETQPTTSPRFDDGGKAQTAPSPSLDSSCNRDGFARAFIPPRSTPLRA
jgi:hypothetical protein